MGTYLIAYEEELTRRIERGGDQEAVDKAFDEYNKFGKAAFEVWLKDAKLVCVHCEKPARTASVEPDEEVSCEEHKS